VNPLVGIRLGHPKQLPLELLERIGLQVAQDEEQLIRHGRSGTMRIRALAAARAGLPINGAGPQVPREGLRQMGQQGLQFCGCSAGHRTSTPSTLGDFLVARHSHLPSSLCGRGEMVYQKP
jgi:hypothetical protein